MSHSFQRNKSTVDNTLNQELETDYCTSMSSSCAGSFDEEMLAKYQELLVTVEEPTAEQLQIEKMLVMKIRVDKLEDLMKTLMEKNLEREKEIAQMNANTEARFRALESRVAEMQSRVLLLEASLTSAGVQRRQRA